MIDVAKTGSGEPSDDITPYLVVFRSGPIHSTESIEQLAKVLSIGYEGVIFVSASFERTFTVGRFQVIARPLKKGVSLLKKAAYMWSVVAEATRIIRRLKRPAVLLCYDPLRVGLIGVVVKRLTGSPLIVEVNGVHSDRVLYKDSVSGSLRRQLILRTASFVLEQADGIRLLFAQQLDRYPIRLKEQVVRVFFDMIAFRRFTNLGEEPFILFVGFPFHLKGVDLLIQAFQRIQAKHADWRLVLIGHDLSNPASALLRDGDRVEFLGPQPNEIVAEWMGRCGVFVLPSRSEGLGRVLLEAAVACKPRIAAAVGGMPTIVEHDVDGLVFPAGDAKALSAALDRLMSDADERRRLGGHAGAMARDRFTEEHYIEHYSEFVDAVLSQPTRGTRK